MDDIANPELAAVTSFAPRAKIELFENPEMNAFGVASGLFRDPDTVGKAALSARMKWEDVAPAFGDKADQFEQAYTQDLNLEQARDRYRGAQETDAGFAARRMVPLGSAIVGLRLEDRYKNAVENLKAGKAKDDDFDVIAQHERFKEIDKERDALRGVASGLAHIPAILGEGAVAGRALGLAARSKLGGRILGLSAKAGEAGVVGTGEALAKASLGVRAGQTGARLAATTAAMPSMYLEEAGRRAAERGGDWTDAANFAPAYGMGMATVAVLGSMQKFINEGSVAKQIVGKTALGMGEQAVVDTSAQIFSDRVLSKAYQLDTGYGLVGDLVKAHKGEKTDVLKHALTQATVFGVFSAIHVGKHKGAEAKALEIPSALADAVREAKERGYENAPEDLVREAGEFLSSVNEGVKTGAVTAESVREQIKADPDNPLNAMKQKAADILKEIVDRSTLDDALTRTQQRDAEARLRAAPEQPDFSRGLRMRPGELEPSASRTRGATPDPEGVEPVPDAPVPPDPVAVLGEDGVRAVAKRFALSGKKIETLLDKIAASPSARAVLNARVAAKLAETTRPTAPEVDVSTPRPETAPEAPPAAEAVKPAESPAEGVERPVEVAGRRFTDKEIADELRQTESFVRDPKNVEFVKYAVGELTKRADAAPVETPRVTGLKRVEKPGSGNDHYLLMAGEKDVGRVEINATNPDVIRLEWVGMHGANTANARQFKGSMGPKAVVSTLTEIAKNYPGAKQIDARRISGARDEAAKSDQEVLFDIVRDGDRVRLKRAKPAAPPDRLSNERPKTALERMKEAQAKRGDAAPRFVGEPLKAKEDVKADQVLAEAQEAREEAKVEASLSPVEREGITKSLDTPAAEKLDARERYVMEQLAAGKTQVEIGNDPAFLAFTGLAAGKNRRSLVGTVQKEARAKLELEKSAAELEKDATAARLNEIETGKPVDVKELTDNEVRAAAPRQERLDAIETQIEALVDEHAAIKNPTPAQIADFVGRYQALTDRLEGRSPEAAVTAGPRRSRGKKKETAPPGAVEVAKAEVPLAAGLAKSAIEAGLANLPAKPTARQVYNQFLARYAEVAKLAPGETGPLEKILRAAGARPFGEVGATVPFDGTLHKAEKGVASGAPVRLVRSGWELPETVKDMAGKDVGRLYTPAEGKAVVEPVAKPKKGKTDAQLKNASKSPEDSLRAWVTSEGGISPAEAAHHFGPTWVKDAPWLGPLVKKTGRTVGLDNLAEMAQKRGLIPTDPARHPEDVLLETIRKNAPIGEALSAKVELEAHQRDRRQEAENQSAQDEAIAQLEFKAKKTEDEIKRSKADGDTGRVRRLTEALDATRAAIDQMKRPYTPGTEDIPFSPGNAAPPGTSPGDSASRTRGAPPITPAQIIADQNRIIGRSTTHHDYRGERRLSEGAEAQADLKAGTTVTTKGAELNPFTNLEEGAHHLSYRGKMETNPDNLPDGVAAGFAELNARFRRPPYSNPRANIVEGYASWVKLRASKGLTKLSKNEQAAADFAEKFSRDKGYTEKLDAIGKLYDNYLAQTAEQRAAGLGSSTGQVPEAQRNREEIATDLAKRFTDDIDNDIAALVRMEERIDKARKAAGRSPLKDEDKASVLLAGVRHSGKAFAGVMERDGVKVMTPDGKWQVVGPALEEIVAGAKPEWTAPGEGGAASRAGTYAINRHIVAERERGERQRDDALTRMQEARDKRDGLLGEEREEAQREVKAREAEFAAALKEAEVRMNLVPEEQFKERAAALKEARADREFAAWAEPFADKLTAGFDATQKLYESVGLTQPGTADMLSKKYPDYVPTDRVRSDAGWNQLQSGKKGEQATRVIQSRSGSGEAIVDPLLSYKRRLLVASEAVGIQLVRRKARDLAVQEDAGPYLAFYQKGSVKTELGQARAQVLKDIGVPQENITGILKQLGLERAESYFRAEPWPEDPSKATIEVLVDGQIETLRVGDRSLYELLTNQQVDAHQTARILNGIANFEVFGVKPVQAQKDVIRTGATGVKLAFQAANIPRDIWSYWKNTIERTQGWGPGAAAVRLIPEYWKTYGRMSRAFADNWREWMWGKGARRNRPEDPLWNEFADARGDQLRQLAFERDNPQKAYNGIATAHTRWSLAKDLLGFIGAGELAPRFREFRKRLEQVTGKSEDVLRKEFEAADKAAREGKPVPDPVPFNQVMAAMHAAAEVTVPFGRQGVVTRQMNQITPFFGPAVAGVSKALRQAKADPKRALMALGLLGSLRTLHWLMYHDEDWYKQLSPHDKFNNFVVDTPIGRRRLPGPRDLDLAVGGTLVTMLDAAGDADPQFAGLLEQSMGAMLPPGIGPAAGDAIKGDVGMAAARGLAMPAGPVGSLGVEMLANKDWTGKPIVPRRDESKTSDWEQFRDHYGPYALKQLTGGRGEASKSGLGLDIFPEVRNLRRSVDELHERYHTLEVQKARAERSGRRFEGEAEFKRLGKARQEIGELAAKARGEKKVGTKTVRGDRPEDEVRMNLMEREAAIARRALGK
jgi:hypothetical protein